MRRHKEEGIVLIITLLIITLLVTLIVEFDYLTRVDLRTATNFRDGVKAYYLARSAVSATRVLLKDDRARSNYDALTELWANPLPFYPLGDGYVSGEIIDEGGKININQTVSPSGNKVEGKVKQVKKLFELLEVDQYLVDAIIDWIDTNDEPEPMGAEDSYYTRLERPYRCKNKPLDTLTELLLIKGIDDKTYEKINRYLTVYSNPMAPSGEININTTDIIVLQTLPSISLTFEVTKELAEKIVELRPFEKPDDLDKVPGMDQIAYNLRVNKVYTVKSDVFSITSSGEVNGIKRTIKAVVIREGAIKVKILSLSVR